MIEEKSTGAEKQEDAKEEVKAAKAGTTLQAKIFAPFKEYFEGECTGISAVNESGPFDILARHHNFITMLVPCNLVVHLPEGDQTFKITRGLMHVRNSKVIVFLDV
jgi:F0F1-type ATP synthase epsilon subunit